MSEIDGPDLQGEIEENQRLLQQLLANQTKYIEKIANHFAPEIEEKRFERLRQTIVKVGSYTALAFGAFLGMWELGAFILEQRQISRLASNYAEVGQQIYYQENNAAVATSFINKAIELEPDNTQFRFLDAYIQGMASVRKMFNLDRPYNGKELNAAYDALAKSILLEQSDPDGAEAYILRGQIYAALKDNKRAKKALDTAILRDPKNAFAWVRKAIVEHNSGDSEAAYRSLDQAHQITDKNKWEYLWRGIFLAGSKKFKKAQGYYQKALEIDPRFDLAYYNLGWSHLKSKPKNYPESEKNFKKALSLNPDFKEAYYALGMVYGYQNSYDVSHSYLTQAVKIDDQYLTGWKWRGIINKERKQYKEALADYSKVIDLDPSNAGIYTRRGRVLTIIEDYEAAIKDFLLARNFAPNDARTRYYLGQAYAALSQNKAAIASYTEAISLKKNYGEALVSRAESYERLGKLESAETDLDLAIRTVSYRPERFLLKRGKYLLRRGRQEAALEDFVSARTSNKKHSPSWLGEAEVAHKLSKQEQALYAVETFLKLKPTSKEGQKLLESIMSSSQN
jgi:tetratricopeptide (TPR) repeat protein